MVFTWNDLSGLTDWVRGRRLSAAGVDPDHYGRVDNHRVAHGVSSEVGEELWAQTPAPSETSRWAVSLRPPGRPLNSQESWMFLTGVPSWPLERQERLR